MLEGLGGLLALFFPLCGAIDHSKDIKIVTSVSRKVSLVRFNLGMARVLGENRLGSSSPA